MVAERVSPDQYQTFFPDPSHVFNTVHFNELNKHKCEEAHYVTIKDDKGKVRFGIILGQKDEKLKSPFSAPFGGIEERGCQCVEHYIEALKALHQYKGDRELIITLPPYFYGRNSHIDKQLCASLTVGAKIAYTDYDYYYKLCHSQTFIAYCNRASRKNFIKSSRQDWSFKALDGNESGIERVYNVIRLNRESHGYPLRMSFDDVVATSRIIDCRFMLLCLGGIDVASVLAYNVSPGISQIVYWGDVPGYSELRPMNMLAYKTFEYLASCGQHIADIGPSSSEGIPSIGLCNFKEGIGCHMTPKHTIIL